MGKLLWIIVIILVIGGWIIFKAGTYEPITEPKNAVGFAVDFGKWVFQVGKSTVKTAKYAADQDWLPKTNQTNQTINETE